MKYNIGQTHQVDLGSPVTYTGNTIYKGGTVVSLNGSLYVAKYNIPPTDEGPLKSNRWELLNVTTPYGYVNAVTDLGWDPTGKQSITSIPDNMNIFLPAGRYYINSTHKLKNVNLLGVCPAYTPVYMRLDPQDITTITLPSNVLETTKKDVIHFQNINFAPFYIDNYATLIFDNCNLKTVTRCYELTIFNHCSLGHDNSTPQSLISASAPALFYDCCVNTAKAITNSNPLGDKNAIWYNPLIKGLTAEQVGSATLYNPTYLEE